MIEKELECLVVGQVTMVAANSFLEHERIATVGQHVLIVVGFQESGMATTKMCRDIAARFAEICKDTDPYISAFYDETLGLLCIMQLGKSNNSNRAKDHWDIC